jgi:hypothetical protein
MTRKIIKYLLFCVPVIILIVYLLNERSPFGGRNSSFASRPKKEITKIEFNGRSADLVLEKKGEEWIVNKKHEARKSSIQFILKILAEMQIKSPITTDLFNEEIINRKVAPVRVKVFERRKVIKSFLVYKTPSNTYGNIMKMREGSKPFIVYVPGNETEIGSAFTVNELFWRPYTVFSLLPSDILSVRLENMADTGSSFIIRNENQRFLLYDMKKELAGWDTSRTIRYLSYFTHVPFESWTFDISADEKEKIKKEMPLYKITVYKTSGEKVVLSLWERSIDENGIKKKDTDRLWGKTDAMDEIFIIRYLDIDPLLKKRSYFFPG